MRRRRIGVLALCRDEQGRVLVVSVDGDEWSLPGGLVGHGEHPVASLRRHLPAGKADVGGPVTVVTDIDHTAHDDWIVLRAAVVPHAGDHRVRWAAADEVGRLALTTATARALGLLPEPPAIDGSSPVRADSAPVDSAPVDSAPVDSAPVDSAPVDSAPEGAVRRRQRFAVYALATDPAGRVLLARISDGYPGAGHWHLPGGGTDAGESATTGLLRELIEETNQRGRLGEPLSVSHRHQRDAMGPEGVPIDWQGVRVVYRVHIDAPTPAQVTEGAGSTVEAGWFTVAEAVSLPLTEVARDSIAQHLR